MAQIHKSHSRKELIDIIEIYEFYDDCLSHYREQPKETLLKNLWIFIQKKDIIFTAKNDTYFFFEDVDDIRLYLLRKSPNKQITDKTLLDINKRVKNIIYYCKNCGYEVSVSNYASLEDIIKDADFVRIYGNLPSVRRAINLLNLDNKIKDDFEVIMSQKTKKSLEEKQRVKASMKPSYKKNVGMHIISFD